MLHIKKSADGQFYVTVTADNGEVLMTSETLTSKAAAFINIKAMARVFSTRLGVRVLDETVEPHSMHRVFVNGDVETINQ